MKRILLAGAMALAAGLSYSQTTIIPKAGLTLASIVGKDKNNEDKSKIGFTVGAGFNLPVGDGKFSVQPEINYIQKGSQADYVAAKATDKLTLGYLEVPILAKITFGEYPSEFYINFGPSFGYGLGGKYKMKGGTDPESSKVKFGGDGEDLDEFYIENAMDIGVQVGAGLLILERVMIDLRYGMGVTSLYKDYDMKNSVLQFTVGSPLSIGGGGGGRGRRR
jgi:hypothetical protein